MSHGRYSAASEVVHLVADFRRMTKEEAERNYGIEIEPNGSIYDSTYEQTFNNVGDWAAYVVAQENDDWDDEYNRHSNKWDDED